MSAFAAWSNDFLCKYNVQIPRIKSVTPMIVQACARPNVCIKKKPAINVPTTAPRVLRPYNNPESKSKYFLPRLEAPTTMGKVMPMSVTGINIKRKMSRKRVLRKVNWEVPRQAYRASNRGGVERLSLIHI